MHSPMPKDDHLSLLRQQALLMERSALQDLEEIGEGRTMQPCVNRVYMVYMVISFTCDSCIKAMGLQTITAHSANHIMHDLIW